jgi:Domain of unknown function (DUF4384)
MKPRAEGETPMRDRKLWLPALAICLLSLSAAAEPARTPLVTLRVEAQTRGKAGSAVTEASALRRGDTIRLEITPGRAAHVHVIHVAPSGRAALLYDGGDKRLRAGQKLRLPPAGESPYMLDDETGRESLAVIASEAPLASLREDYAALVRAARERESLPPRTPLLIAEPAPLRATQRPAEPVPGIHDLQGPMRGLVDRSGTVRAFADAAGVAMAVLQFDHVP